MMCPVHIAPAGVHPAKRYYRLGNVPGAWLQYVGDAIGITSRGRELMNVVVRFVADDSPILG